MGPFETNFISVACTNCGQSRSLNQEEIKMDTTSFSCPNCKTQYSFRDGIISALTSENVFSIFEFISNVMEYGKIMVKIGEAKYIKFPNTINHVAKVFLTPEAPCMVEASHIHSDGFYVLSSQIENANNPTIGNSVNVNWIAYGRNEDFIEPWRQLLAYSRQSYIEKNYIGSILFAEMGFESYIDSVLSAGYFKIGMDRDSVTRFLMNAEMPEKVNPLMSNVFGIRLSSLNIWKDWEKKVLKWRNEIAHGNKLTAKENEAQLAFAVIVEAIIHFNSIVLMKSKG